MKVTSRINIDLRNPNPGVRVDAVQGDVNTRAVEISLFDGGSAWKVPSGVTAALAYKKPDSQHGCLDKSASVTVSGSAITIVMTKQMLATPGTVNACVVLTDASKNQLTAFPFSVSVAANPAADAQQSDEPIKVDTSDATAAAGDIVVGKTAYVHGKKVTGAHECAESLDTSDATATADDMAKGKTAYVNGQKVTGNVPVQGSIGIDGATVETVEDKIRLSANFPSKKIMNSGAVVQLRTPKSNFGDAEASDVADGKTVTSAAGLKVTGTRAEPSIILENNVLFIQ